MSPNPLANLKIDCWYKALVVIATALLLLSLTIDLIGIDNTIVQLLSLGLLLIGVGEWINYPLKTASVRPNVFAPSGGKITGYNKRSVLLGILFVLLGVIIICIGILKIFYKGNIFPMN